MVFIFMPLWNNTVFNFISNKGLRIISEIKAGRKRNSNITSTPVGQVDQIRNVLIIDKALVKIIIARLTTILFYSLPEYKLEMQCLVDMLWSLDIASKPQILQLRYVPGPWFI